jgi:hypothetical protein
VRISVNQMETAANNLLKFQSLYHDMQQ